MAVFKEDKTVYCSSHKKYYQDISDNSDFSLERLITIDMDSESRKKQKWIDLRTARCFIGSLKIQSLGRISEISDTTEALIPIGFSCSRWFWSTLDPNKRIKYHCKTKLVKGKKKLNIDEAHLVINHDVIEDKEFEKQLNDMRIELRKIEVSNSKKSLSNILPPYAVSSLWNNLKYQDLHKEHLPKDAIDPEIDEIGSPSKKRKMYESSPNVTTQMSEQKSTTSSPRSLNKAITNVLVR